MKVSQREQRVSPQGFRVPPVIKYVGVLSFALLAMSFPEVVSAAAVAGSLAGRRSITDLTGMQRGACSPPHLVPEGPAFTLESDSYSYESKLLPFSGDRTFSSRRVRDPQPGLIQAQITNRDGSVDAATYNVFTPGIATGQIAHITSARFGSGEVAVGWGEVHSTFNYESARWTILAPNGTTVLELSGYGDFDSVPRPTNSDLSPLSNGNVMFSASLDDTFINFELDSTGTQVPSTDMSYTKSYSSNSPGDIAFGEYSSGRRGWVFADGNSLKMVIRDGASEIAGSPFSLSSTVNNGASEHHSCMTTEGFVTIWEGSDNALRLTKFADDGTRYELVIDSGSYSNVFTNGTDRAYILYSSGADIYMQAVDLAGTMAKIGCPEFIGVGGKSSGVILSDGTLRVEYGTNTEIKGRNVRVNLAGNTVSKSQSPTPSPSPTKSPVSTASPTESPSVSPNTAPVWTPGPLSGSTPLVVSSRSWVYDITSADVGDNGGFDSLTFAIDDYSDSTTLSIASLDERKIIIYPPLGTDTYSGWIDISATDTSGLKTVKRLDFNMLHRSEALPVLVTPLEDQIAIVGKNYEQFIPDTNFESPVGSPLSIDISIQPRNIQTWAAVTRDEERGGTWIRGVPGDKAVNILVSVSDNEYHFANEVWFDIIPQVKEGGGGSSSKDGEIAGGVVGAIAGIGAIAAAVFGWKKYKGRQSGDRELSHRV